MTNEQKVITESDRGISRREFLEITGFVAGIAAASVLVPKVPLTGVFISKAEAVPAEAGSETWIPSVCRMCPVLDAIRVKVVDGKVVRIEGDPRDKTSNGFLCARGNSGLWMAYDPYRVKKPLKRTNPKKGADEDPKWVEISWDEAYNTIAEQVKKVRAKGKDGWVLDRPRYSALSFSEFGNTFGSFLTEGVTKVEDGMNWCGHVAHYLSRVAHGGFTSRVDYERCNYLIHFGRSHGLEGGANFVPSAQLVADARARGMKIVHIDPRLGIHASKADEWIPILPGTDGAFASAMLYVLLHELKVYDADYIKKWTNGPYLIGPDGLYVRDKETKKPLVWDAAEGKAKTYDDTTIKDYALEGSYTAAGVQAKPAFQLLKDSVKDMTPEWAAKITDAPPATIRRVAKEYAAAARIGSTITIGGVPMPYRPACTDYYGGNAANHLHGTPNGWSIELLNTVIGAQDVPGGHCGASPPWTRGGPDGMIEHPRASYTVAAPYHFEYPPKTPELEEFFPWGDHFGAVTFNVLNNPDKFWGIGKHGVDFAFFHATNPLIGMYDTHMMHTNYSKVGFIVYSCLTIEETATYADIIIPDRCYLEEYQTAFPVLMQPVVKPPYDIPYLTDVFIEISQRAGILYGPKGFNAFINTAKSLKDEFKLDENKKYTTEEIFDRLCKNSLGKDKGLEWAKKTGGERPAPRLMYMWYKAVAPDGKPRRLPIYVEAHVRAREELRKNMQPHMDEIRRETGVDWNEKLNDYQPLPAWIPSHLLKPTPPYDLIALAWLSNMHTFSTTNAIPWIAEVALLQDPYMNYVWIHEDTAKQRGIADGDLIWVEAESTGLPEGVKRKIKARARLSQGIHPQCIGINRTMGGWGRNSVVRKMWEQNLSPTYQILRPDLLQYIDGVTDALENCIKVRVTKA